MHVIHKGTVVRDLYQIEDKLGEGGMAWVYRARHTRLGHEVAIKLLFPHLANDISIRERFMAEAQIQSQIKHPNIAHVIDMIEEQGMFGFVMEWCNACDLRQWMRKQGKSPTVEQWHELFLPIVGAMAFAHEEGYVHRDLKPSNILLDRHQGTLCPKVSDFGIAKILGVTGRTRTGSLMGTLAYMSPEQVEDSKQTDPRSDVYSLGVVLYELATGRLPYEETGPSVVLQIFRDPPAPPKEAPKPLQAIILKCLEKNPDDRYPDCHAMLAALEQALADRSARRWGQVTYPPPSEDQVTRSAIEPAPALPISGALDETVPPVSFVQVGMEQSAHDSYANVRTAAAFGETAEADVFQLAAVSGAEQESLALAPSTIHLGPRQTAKDSEVSSSFTKTAAGGLSGPWARRLLLLGVLFFLGGTSAAVWELDPFHWRSPVMPQAKVDAGTHVTGRVVPRPDSRSLAHAPDGAPPTTRILAPPTPRLVRGRVVPRLPDVASRKAPPDVVLRRVVKVLPLPTPLRRVSVPTRRVPVRRRVVPRRRAAVDRRPPALGACPEPNAVLCKLWRVCHTGTSAGAGSHCTKLGAHYALAKGVKRDRKLAAHYYEIGCQRGDPEGCTNLGVLYVRGAGVKRNYKQAHKLYTKACKRKYMRACYNRGVLFERGRGVAVDHRAASRLYRTACEGNYASACMSLGFNLSRGRGTKKSKTGAVRSFAKACRYAHARSCWWAGHYVARGWGGRVDYKRANGFFAKSCKYGFGWGCRDLGMSYELGRSLSVQMARANTYYKRADKLLRRSCRGRSSVACYWAGLAYAEGRGVSYSCRTANRYYRKACRLGYKKGCRQRCVSHKSKSKQQRSKTFLEMEP